MSAYAADMRGRSLKRARRPGRLQTARLCLSRLTSWCLDRAGQARTVESTCLLTAYGSRRQPEVLSSIDLGGGRVPAPGVLSASVSSFFPCGPAAGGWCVCSGFFLRSRGCALCFMLSLIGCGPWLRSLEAPTPYPSTCVPTRATKMTTPIVSSIANINEQTCGWVSQVERLIV